MSKEEEEMSKYALSTFRAKEEEIENKNMEVKEKVQAQLGRIEDETKHLATIHEVTDEEGRRRFHGAFTGGFSAGYYNIVGSKEGWTPQSFNPSRKNRAKVKQQSIYNFRG